MSNIIQYTLQYEHDITWTEAKQQLKKKAKLDKIKQVMSIKK